MSEPHTPHPRTRMSASPSPGSGRSSEQTSNWRGCVRIALLMAREVAAKGVPGEGKKDEGPKGHKGPKGQGMQVGFCFLVSFRSLTSFTSFVLYRNSAARSNAKADFTS